MRVPVAIVAAALACSSCLAADFPLLSLRIRDGLDVPKDSVAPFFDVLSCYRGTFDDIWFCSGWNYSGPVAAEAGAECCLWTEVVHSPEELRFKAFNRLGAFAQAMGCHPSK